MTLKTKLAQITLLVTLLIGAVGFMPLQSSDTIEAPRMGDCAGGSGTCT